MNILNQDIISQRIKSDAELIRTTCKFDVKDDVLKHLTDIEMIDVTTPILPKKPLFQRVLLPMVGVAVLTLIFVNMNTPTVINNAGIQNSVLENRTIDLVQVDSVSVKADSVLEKQAIKEDILYLSQVFSM